MTGNRFNRLPRASLFSPTTPTPVADRGASGRRQATKAEQAEFDAMPKLPSFMPSSGQSVPRTFGFNTIKDSYTCPPIDDPTHTDNDYAKATLIKESEVISYSFKKTKPEQIYQKVDVQYNKD